MKKIYLPLLLCLALLTSCMKDKNEYEYPYYNVFLTVVDNDNNNSNFYVVTDANEKFYNIETLSTSEGTYRPESGTRMLTSFTLLSSITGEVNNIKIFSCIEVPVDTITKVTAENQDSIKDDPYYKSADPYISVNSVLTYIASFDAEKISNQKFYLIQKEDTKGDGKCHLELRFTNDAQGTKNKYTAPLSYDISSLKATFPDSIRVVLYTNENDAIKTYNIPTHKWQ